MTQQFMTDSVIRTKYGITGTATFDETFSKVSLENIWFSIVASAIWVLESLFDAFREDVDAKIATAVLASIPWYHKIALEFQYGDELVFDEETQQFVYPELHPAKQVVKYAACRDVGGGVYVLASGATPAGTPIPLDADVLTAFESYLNQRKPAGVIIEVGSYAADRVRVYADVQYNPQVINASGQLVEDTTIRPVDDAINDYLHGIEYGGVLNKTALVDAIQAVPGVVDIKLDKVTVRSAISSAWKEVVGNNYESYSGAFRSYNLPVDIHYVLSI